MSESDGDETVQQTADNPESIIIVPEQESSQRTTEYKDALLQIFERNVEKPLQPEDGGLKGSLLALMKDPRWTAEQEANNMVQQECNRTGFWQETASVPQTLTYEEVLPRHLDETASSPASKQSHYVFSPRPRGLEQSPFSLPRTTRYYRPHFPHHQRLPPVPEEEDPPLGPLQVLAVGIFEPLVQALNTRLHTVRTEMRDYVQRIRERHIPPESQELCEELQTRCVKLICSLLLGGIIVVALYFLIDYLEKKYDNGGYNSTSARTDFYANLGIRLTTVPADLDITTLAPDLDDNVTTVIATLGNNVTSVAAVWGNNVASVATVWGNDVTTLAVDWVNDVTTAAVDWGNDVTSAAVDWDTDVTTEATDWNTDVKTAAADWDTDVKTAAADWDTDVTTEAADWDTDVTTEAAYWGNYIKPAAVDWDTVVTTAATDWNTAVTSAAVDWDTAVKPAAADWDTAVKPAAADWDTAVTTESADWDTDVTTEAADWGNYIKRAAVDWDTAVKSAAVDWDTDVTTAAVDWDNAVTSMAAGWVNAVNYYGSQFK